MPGPLIFRHELLFGAVISITAGPTEHLSVSPAQEAAPLASYVSASSDARNPKMTRLKYLGRAFDKAAEGSRSRFAADAGLWELNASGRRVRLMW